MSQADNDALAAQSVEALFDMSIDEIPDMPPSGVPPTGCYSFKASFQHEIDDEAEKKCANTGHQFKMIFEITAIEVVANEQEANEVAVGQRFIRFYNPFWGQDVKDKQGRIIGRAGQPNANQQSLMKMDLKPFGDALGLTKMQEIMEKVQEIPGTMVITRTPNKKRPEYPKFKFEDLTVNI